MAVAINVQDVRYVARAMDGGSDECTASDKQFIVISLMCSAVFPLMRLPL